MPLQEPVASIPRSNIPTTRGVSIISHHIINVISHPRALPNFAPLFSTNHPSHPLQPPPLPPPTPSPSSLYICCCRTILYTLALSSVHTRLVFRSSNRKPSRISAVGLSAREERDVDSWEVMSAMASQGKRGEMGKREGRGWKKDTVECEGRS